MAMRSAASLAGRVAIVILACVAIVAVLTLQLPRTSAPA
jgi:hypothetical protein